MKTHENTLPKCLPILPRSRCFQRARLGPQGKQCVIQWRRAMTRCSLRVSHVDFLNFVMNFYGNFRHELSVRAFKLRSSAGETPQGHLAMLCSPLCVTGRMGSVEKANSWQLQLHCISIVDTVLLQCYIPAYLYQDRTNGWGNFRRVEKGICPMNRSFTELFLFNFHIGTFSTKLPLNTVHFILAYDIFTNISPTYHLAISNCHAKRFVEITEAFCRNALSRSCW